MASTKNSDLSNIIRDLKKFTSKKIIDAIIKNDHESHKDWMLSIFKEQGSKNSRNDHYQFWRQDNQPKECYSPEFTIQKLNYIHDNPVAAAIVDKPEDYIYSSTRDYHNKKHCGLIKIDII
jgi:hypothetical protein